MSSRDLAENGKSIKCGIIHMIDQDKSIVENKEINDRFKNCRTCSCKTVLALGRA